MLKLICLIMQQKKLSKILRMLILLANLKTEVDKFDIDKLKILPNKASNLKTKLDKIDIDKLVQVPVDLSKLNNVVNNDVVKKTEY